MLNNSLSYLKGNIVLTSIIITTVITLASPTILYFLLSVRSSASETFDKLKLQKRVGKVIFFLQNSDFAMILIFVFLFLLVQNHAPQRITTLIQSEDFSEIQTVKNALSYAIGLTVLISLVTGFLVSRTKSENIYLGENLERTRLLDTVGYRLSASRAFRLLLATLYLIPICTAFTEGAHSNWLQISFHSGKWPFSFWIASYCTLILVLTLCIYDYLYLLATPLPRQLDSAKRIVDTELSKYSATLITEYIRGDIDISPLYLCRNTPSAFSEDERFRYIELLLCPSNKAFTFAELSALYIKSNVRKRRGSSKIYSKHIDQRLSNLTRYIINKWRYLYDLVPHGTNLAPDGKLLQLIKGQYNRDQKVLSIIKEEWPEAYTRTMSGNLVSLDSYEGFATRQHDTINRIEELVARCLNFAALRSMNGGEICHAADDSLQMTRIKVDDEEIEKDTHYKILQNTISTALDYLRKNSWKDLTEVSDWIDKYEQCFTVDDRATLHAELLAYARANVQSAAVLEALLRRMSFDERMAHIIYKSAHAKRTYSLNPIISHFDVYQRIFSSSATYLTAEEEKSTQDIAAEVWDILKHTNINHFFTLNSTEYVIATIADHSPITMETYNETQRIGIGFLNYLLIRSLISLQPFDYLSIFHLEIHTDAEKYELHALADEAAEFTKRHPDVMAKWLVMLKMEINSALQKWGQEQDESQ